VSEMIRPGANVLEAEPRPVRTGAGRRGLGVGAIIAYIFLAIVLAIYLYPVLYLINTALKSNQEFFTNPTGVVRSLKFGNFLQAWQQGNFAAYFLNSMLYTFVAAGLGTLMSLMVGFPVARGYLKHTKLWNGLFVAMMFLPNTLVMLFQLALRMNLYDTRMGYILILASGVGVGPLLVTGYLKSIPREIDEAAALDGTSYFHYLFRFIPKLLQPVLSTIFILQAIGVWNDIILATILLPDQAKSPMTLGLFAFRGTYTSEWSLLAAATILVALPMVIVYVFLQRYIVASVVGGAVKG